MVHRSEGNLGHRPEGCAVHCEEGYLDRNPPENFPGYSDSHEVHYSINPGPGCPTRNPEDYPGDNGGRNPAGYLGYNEPD